MVKLAEKLRQSDVNFWGALALGAAALAVVGGNIGALLPDSALTALHSSRLEGGNLNSLRTKVAELENETARVRRENARLMSMYTIADQGRGEISRRLGALEASLPVWMENQQISGSNIDQTVTASVSGGVTQSREVSGGSVSISRTPLANDDARLTAGTQDLLPELPETDTRVAMAELDMLDQVSTESFGVALGQKVSLQDSYIAWTELRDKVGALLLGFEPVLSRNADGFNIVAGPIETVAQAEQLCQHITRVGLQCLPAPYSGLKMPQ